MKKFTFIFVIFILLLSISNVNAAQSQTQEQNLEINIAPGEGYQEAKDIKGNIIPDNFNPEIYLNGNKLEIYRKNKKSPALGTALAVIPGGGDFYINDYNRGLIKIGIFAGTIYANNVLTTEETKYIYEDIGINMTQLNLLAYGITVIGDLFTNHKRVKKYNKQLFQSLTFSYKSENKEYNLAFNYKF